MYAYNGPQRGILKFAQTFAEFHFIFVLWEHVKLEEFRWVHCIGISNFQTFLHIFTRVGFNMHTFMYAHICTRSPFLRLRKDRNLFGVCVCVFVCICAHIHVCVRVYEFTHGHTCVYVYAHTRIMSTTKWHANMRMCSERAGIDSVHSHQVWTREKRKDKSLSLSLSLSLWVFLFCILYVSDCASLWVSLLNEVVGVPFKWVCGCPF